MGEILQKLKDSLGDSLPTILGALAIIIVGWLIAVVVRAVVRKSLSLMKLNAGVEKLSGSRMDVERALAVGAFYLILLFALIGFFSALRLPLVSEPLQALLENLLDFVPNLIAAGVLVLVAWLLATVLRKLTVGALAATNLDDKLSTEAGMKPMSRSLGNVIYGLVLLLFLPGILDALGLQGLLHPVQGMVDEILAMLPNLFAAVVLGGVGWFVANLLRNLVANLLAATGADKLGQRAGLRGTMTLSRLAGLIVFIFVFVPALIAALNALEIESISRPATDMLGTFMSAIPNLFAAGVILALAFFVSGLIANLVVSLLGGLGFDGLPGKLGLGSTLPAGTTPSQFVGKLIVFFVLLFATVEAANVLGFTMVSDLVAVLIEFGGQVLLGVVTIAIGLWIANLAHGAIRRMETPNAAFLAGMARFAILGVVFAMGLSAMGVGEEIVLLAFALTLGALAVAFALSFGLGGREAAGRQMEHWLSRLRSGHAGGEGGANRQRD